VSQIVTFYSYKGGVGRSMALANIAVLLARRPLRVLVVDWDLEAPGLERFFTYFTIDPRGGGLLNMFTDRAAGRSVDYTDYLWTVSSEEVQISFLPSGKDVDADYSVKLEQFDWEAFFQDGGGNFVESLRDRWREEYDVVLIDSRTGLSDTGGICTIQLPDIVVAMFTANHQSLYGVRDVLRLVQGARQSLAYDRVQLAIVPLASRFGVRTEFRESQEWLDRFTVALSEFYRDWLPVWVDKRQVVERLKIPQVDFFGFGEKLAVIEHGTSDPDGMGFVYEQVATLLANNLTDAEHVLRLDRVERKAAPGREDYLYDIYVSYAHEPLVEETLRPILELLQQWCSELKGEELRVFVDYTELGPGVRWSAKLEDALARSKLLLAVVTPRSLESDWTRRELAVFNRREQHMDPSLNAEGLVFPILLRGSSSELPDEPRKRQYFDLTQVTVQEVDTPSLRLSHAVQELARQIVERLDRVPPFDPKLTAEPPEPAPPRSQAPLPKS
jgi:MinD-like ATPase involved in chromosome partitioning or flagellar assembly